MQLRRWWANAGQATDLGEFGLFALLVLVLGEGSFERERGVLRDLRLDNRLRGVSRSARAPGGRRASPPTLAAFNASISSWLSVCAPVSSNMSSFVSTVASTSPTSRVSKATAPSGVRTKILEPLGRQDPHLADAHNLVRESVWMAEE